MNTQQSKAWLIPLAAMGLTASALAGVPDAAADISPPPSASGWEFRVEPYGWLTGLDGKTGVGPLVTELSPSFSDILDYLDMAAALQFEARNGRWGILADGFYADLGGSGSTPGRVYDHVDVDMKQFIGELSVSYRVYECDQGFVDVYGGFRYNNLSLDFEAALDPAGIASLSSDASDRIVEGLQDRAEAIVEPKVDEFKTAAAAERTKIEDKVRSKIEAEADKRVKRLLIRQLEGRGSRSGVDLRKLESDKISLALKKERLALTQAAADLEVAKLRASVDASLQNKVNQAQSRVKQAEQDLANAINKQITARAPTAISEDKDWFDPILGVRAQWNFNDKWFLAGRSDIGGFSVGSDLTWSVQGTVGYRFTEKVSAELGYRYLDTDYKDGAFTYDMAEHGIFTGLNIVF